MRICPISSSALGVAVSHVDLKLASSQDVAVMWGAMQARGGLLVVKGQTLTPRECQQAAAKFAPFLGEPLKYDRWPGQSPGIDDAECVALLGNYRARKQDDLGVVGCKPGDRIAEYKPAITEIEEWHTDGSFLASPKKAILLYAPKGDYPLPSTGGRTGFASCTRAYRRLAESEQKQYACMSSVHSWEVFMRLLERRDPSREKVTAADVAKKPDQTWPIVRVHPPTGEPSLYVNPKNTRCVLSGGRREDDGSKLIDNLGKLIVEEAYYHKWEAGDFVLWDNRCLLHAATPFDATKHERLLFRLEFPGEPVQGFEVTYATAPTIPTLFDYYHSYRAKGAVVAHVIDTAHPGDTAALERWLDTKHDVKVLSVVGKTEGNGCVNDFTRGYASHCIHETLKKRRLDDGVAVVMSGGTEGVLTPHFLVLGRNSGEEDVEERTEGPHRLVVGSATSRTLLPEEIGADAQVEATKEAVLQACADAKLSPSDAAFVQVKCPLLTTERVNEAKERRNATCATKDTLESMALSRRASALGVALATGESGEYSSVASASAGVELMNVEVVVLGNRAGAPGNLMCVNSVMKDALDTSSVVRSLNSAGLRVENGTLHDDARKHIVAVLSKADPSSTVRGKRTTMYTDSDIASTRHARAAVGGALGALFGDTRLYVSGGAEAQGPPGGGPVCVIYEAQQSTMSIPMQQWFNEEKPK